MKRRGFFGALAGLFAAPVVAQAVEGKAQAAYTITNVTPNRAYDASNVGMDELADALGTLIKDLQHKGLID